MRGAITGFLLVLFTVNLVGPGTARANSESDGFEPARQSPWLQFDAGFVFSDSPTPPVNVEWTPVTLPDIWRDEAQWRQGISGWYRFPLDSHLQAGNPPAVPYAVYLYRFSMNAAVFLNEEFVGSGGSFEEPIARNWNRPLLFSLPRSAWQREDNWLYVHLRVYPGFGHMAPPAVGPTELFESAYQSRYTAQITFGQIAFLVSVMGAVFGLAFWLVDRSSTVYGYFALCGATWSIYSLNLFLQNLPFSAEIWWWLVHACIDLFSVSVVLFAHRLLGVKKPQIERVLWAYAGAAALIYAVAGIPGIARWNPLVHLGDLICGIYVLGFLLRQAIGKRNPDAWVFAGCIMVMMALAVHDQILNAVLLPDAWATRNYLLQFASPLMLLVMMVHLTRRFRLALVQSRRTTEALNQEVSRVSSELEASYERQRILDQRQVASSERERIYQDLHDEVGGTLLSLVYAAPDSKSQQLARSALDEIRTIVASDPAERCTLAEFSADLRRDTEERLNAAGIRLDWHLQEAAGGEHLTGVQRYEAHKILREVFANAVRHSEATAVSVHLDVPQGDAGQAGTAKAERFLHIEVMDDGRGLPESPRSGRGLSGIRKRAEGLGASVHWHNLPTGGLSFELHVPLTPETGGAGASPQIIGSGRDHID